MGEDPIGFEGGDGSLYRYVGNDPVNGSDPGALLWCNPFSPGSWWNPIKFFANIGDGTGTFAGETYVAVKYLTTDFDDARSERERQAYNPNYDGEFGTHNGVRRANNAVGTMTAVAETGVALEAASCAMASPSGTGKTLGPSKYGPPRKTPTSIRDKWCRTPTSVQDKMVLDAARKGAGEPIGYNLGDPKFRGWEKWQYKVKSADGLDTVVHYVRNPKNGALADFKFKKVSTDTPGTWAMTPEPRVSPTGQ